MFVIACVALAWGLGASASGPPYAAAGAALLGGMLARLVGRNTSGMNRVVSLAALLLAAGGLPHVVDPEWTVLPLRSQGAGVFLLLLRGLILLTTAWAAMGDVRARTWLGPMVVLLALSLRFNAVTVVLLLAWVVLVRRFTLDAPVTMPWMASGATGPVVALVGTAALLVRVLVPAPPPPDAGTVRFDDEARAWMTADNPYRALPFALKWEAQEAAPGEGALMVARIAQRLGQWPDAEARLRRLETSGADEHVRERARQMLLEREP